MNGPYSVDDGFARASVVSQEAGGPVVGTQSLSAHEVVSSGGTATGTWSHERRVVIKAEVVRIEGREPRDNARFVITNIERGGAEHIYDIYRGRGDMENRLKDLHEGLSMDRTSCSSFKANQFRVLADARRLRTDATTAARRAPHRLRAGTGRSRRRDPPSPVRT